LLLTDLVASLRDQRLPDGTTDNVGEILVNWVRIHNELLLSVN